MPRDRWPTVADLEALATGIRTSSGQALRFVPPPERPSPERRHYELRVAEHGEVETRPGNWHDLFNALQWIAWPRAKAALNAQHAAVLEAGGEAELRQRSPRRDALTLLDEGGLVVASTSPEAFRRIEGFRWKELFWHERRELQETTRFLAFGHALSEKGLAPYVGMVAKTLFVPVDADFLRSDAAAQRTHCDAFLARLFSDAARIAKPKDLAPLPVLGIPGWHPGTGTESFYDDPSHFRASRPRPPRL